MKRRHVKFIWGSSDVIKGHWYLGVLGFYDRVEGKHDDGLAISVRGVGLWAISAAVAGYLAFATALFFFWERNPYSLLTYSEALFRPLRREAVRDKQGQAFIAQGEDALRAKHWAEGVALLRQGLAYHPGDLRARLTLAQFYVLASQRLVALKILQDGLAAEYPGRAFLQVMFDVAEQGEDFDLVVRTSDRYLPRLKGDANARDRRWLVSREFAALLNAKQFVEALALADAEEPGEMASEHRVLAQLGRGQPDDALAALAEWRTRPGADARTILRLRARAQREAKRFDEMDRALDELKTMAPADPRTYVYGVIQRAMAGRSEAAGAGLDDFLFRFGGTVQNLQMVAEPLAEIGNRPLLERCAAAATERGYALASFQVLLVQTYVTLGDWAAATRTLAAMKPVSGRAAPQAQLWHDWMQRLIAAASVKSDATSQGLVDFLRSRPWPVKIFQKSIDALRTAGALEAARDVIAVASAAFPASASIEAHKVEVARLLAAQQAANAAPVVVVGNLPGEKIYFQRLGDLLRDEQWGLVEQFIREARSAKPPPAWLEKRDAELRLAAMQINQGRGEMIALIAAAKLYLNGDNDRSQRVLDFGRAAFARGDHETAIALGREVIRRTPDYPPAQRLMSEWQPKPAKK